MTRPAWEDVRSTFETLVDRPLEEQTNALNRLRLRDAGLADQVEALLAHERASPSFLDEGQRSACFDPLIPTGPGRRLGRYRIVRELGQGGMATVFEGVQDAPKRRVALKLLHSGARGSEADRRLVFEANVLAHLRHPNIAKVYEFVEQEGDDPSFLALEFVPGARDLVRYAEEEGLSRDARLDLFLQACDAVAFAHRHGIIHRDLKPANLLVDEEGCVKVIDFGIARPLPGTSLERSFQTQGSRLLGTLMAMAPEQLDGEAPGADTRADVYSLGCVLYELIEGEWPFDVFDQPIASVIRRLREGEPRAPRLAPRELRWVLLRALAKDPERRYWGALELAQDVRRFRTGEPVTAAPPSRVYRARKFVQRNRALVTGALAVFAALGIGLVLTEGQRRRAVEAEELQTRLASDAERARAEALQQAAETRAALDKVQRASNRTRAVHDLLIEMFDNAGGPHATAVELLQTAEQRVERLFAGEPGLRANVRSTLAKMYMHVGELEAGRRLLEAAVAEVRAEVDPLEIEHVQVELDWMQVLFRERRFDEVVELCLSLEPRVARADLFERRVHANLLMRMAAAHHSLGDSAEAADLYRRGVDLLLEEGLTDELDTWRGRVGESMCLRAQGQPEAALEPAHEALANLRRILGDDSAALGLPLGEVVQCAMALDDFEAAVPLLIEKAELIGRTRGRLDVDRIADLTNLATCLVNLERHDEALPYADEVVRACEELAWGDLNRDQLRHCSLSAKSNLARIASALGDRDDAARIIEEALRADELLGPPTTHDPAILRYHLAGAVSELGQATRALELLEQNLSSTEAPLVLVATERLDHLRLLVQLAEDLGTVGEYGAHVEELAEIEASSGR